MATANDLITRAFRRARVIGKDQTPVADEAADALAELNSLLDEWWNESGITVFRILQENFALVAGQASRTMGTGGNFNTTRPLKLVAGCFVRRDSVDYPLTVIEDRTLYDRLIRKSSGISAIPEYVFYDPAVPLASCYFYPVPDQADQVYLNSPSRLQSVAALVTAIVLPPAYDRLVVNGLAIAIAPEYGVEVPASVSRAFAQTKRVLARTNSSSPIMGFDTALMPRRARFDIYSGEER